MTRLLLRILALLLATTAAAPAAAVATDNNGTHDGGSKTATSSRVLCTGEGCDAPPAQAQALPLYGYYPSPPAVPSLPSAPPAPPSAPGSKTPCPPVTVVCCGGGAGAGAGGQFPQQPGNYGPPADGYVPYHNASASPPLLLLPVTASYFVTIIACVFLLWTLV